MATAASQGLYNKKHEPAKVVQVGLLSSVWERGIEDLVLTHFIPKCKSSKSNMN